MQRSGSRSGSRIEAEIPRDGTYKGWKNEHPLFHRYVPLSISIRIRKSLILGDYQESQMQIDLYKACVSIP